MMSLTHEQWSERMLHRYNAYLRTMSSGQAHVAAYRWCEKQYGPEPKGASLKLKLGARVFLGKEGSRIMLTKLKRWGPVVGSGFLAAIVVLKAIGREDVAKILETAGGLLGVLSQTDVSATEVGAAVVALTGVTLKVVSQVQKARTK